MTTKITDANLDVIANKFINWQSVITAAGDSSTAVAGRGYIIDTSSNTYTLNLPATATKGDTIVIKDYAGTFGTNKVTIGRNGHSIQGVANNSELTTNRASVTLVYIDSTKGWLFSDEHNVAELQNSLFVTATGGTETTSGDYKIHTFTGDGTLCVSCAGNDAGSNTVDYLVIAGGGGGSPGITNVCVSGAGGGAGGYRESVPSPAAWTASPLANPGGALPVSVQGYPVTVGGGGSVNNNGSNSVFSTITSAGGGKGGSGSPPGPAGGPGGSGGGQGSHSPSSGAGNSPPVSPPQGNPGGNRAPNGQNSGGGGGAGGTGQNGNVPAPLAARGGDGTTSSISGSSITRGGGGGGGAGNPPNGFAPGGGGRGAGYNGQPSTAGGANQGGGGGGGSGFGPAPSFPPAGSSGGKGIVIIRYKYQ